MKAYTDFKNRFKLIVGKQHHLVVNTLANIFTMRLIGNKTHGDLAEIGIAEFINQFMYDFRSIHVGKDLYRAKEQEEDIVIINEVTGEEFPVSLKAYGVGPLQLSTDSDQKMFPSISIYNETFEGIFEDVDGIENVDGIKELLNKTLPEILDARIIEIIFEQKDEEDSKKLLEKIIEDCDFNVSDEKLSLSMLYSQKKEMSNKDLVELIKNVRGIPNEQITEIHAIKASVKNAKDIVKNRKDEIKTTKEKIKSINAKIQPILAGKGKDIKDKGQIQEIFNSNAFADFENLNIFH